MLVVENPDRFAIRLTEQISSIGLFAVTESQCTEDEHDDEEIPNLEFGLSRYMLAYVAMRAKCCRTNANHDQSDRKRL